MFEPMQSMMVTVKALSSGMVLCGGGCVLGVVGRNGYHYYNNITISITRYIQITIPLSPSLLQSVYRVVVVDEGVLFLVRVRNFCSRFYIRWCRVG